MKGNKRNRSARATGGVVENDSSPSTVYEGESSNVVKEARERKRGGRAKKNVGMPEGMMMKKNAGRKPRKSGGKVGADTNPFSSARNGTPARGRSNVMSED